MCHRDVVYDATLGAFFIYSTPSATCHHPGLWCNFSCENIRKFCWTQVSCNCKAEWEASVPLSCLETDSRSQGHCLSSENEFVQTCSLWLRTLHYVDEGTEMSYCHDPLTPSAIRSDAQINRMLRIRTDGTKNMETRIYYERHGMVFSLLPFIFQ